VLICLIPAALRFFVFDRVVRVLKRPRLDVGYEVIVIAFVGSFTESRKQARQTDGQRVCVYIGMYVCNSYVEDDAKFRYVFQLCAEQLPDSLLVVSLPLVERLVVMNDVRPTTFQREQRRALTLGRFVVVVVVIARV